MELDWILGELWLGLALVSGLKHGFRLKSGLGRAGLELGLGRVVVGIRVMAAVGVGIMVIAGVLFGIR